MTCYTIQQKTANKGRENSQLRDLQRKEDSGDCIRNPGKQIQGPTGDNGTKVKGCQRHCFNKSCVALHNIRRTHQVRQIRAQNKADDIADIANEWLYMCLMKTTGILQGMQNLSKTY